MKFKYIPEKFDAYEVFLNELPEVVSLKLAELKSEVQEKAEVLLMAEEGLERIRSWFYKEMYRLWVYEPAKKALDTCYRELKKFYWLDKRLKGGLFNAQMTASEFKMANPIYETIERYVPINSRGFALCPFHPEKTNSLKVYEDHWYCFGCGEKGDVITFLMKIHNLTFQEVLNAKTKT